MILTRSDWNPLEVIGIPGSYTALVVMYKFGLHKPQTRICNFDPISEVSTMGFWLLEVKPTLSSRSILGSLALVSA